MLPMFARASPLNPLYLRTLGERYLDCTCTARRGPLEPSRKAVDDEEGARRADCGPHSPGRGDGGRALPRALNPPPLCMPFAIPPLAIPPPLLTLPLAMPPAWHTLLARAFSFAAPPSSEGRDATAAVEAEAAAAEATTELELSAGASLYGTIGRADVAAELAELRLDGGSVGAVGGSA